ncbi:acetyl-CoA synthetase-like protein [Rhodocollybia butyracea]|uniref:Acetyl-CoA synthetase-like protein n=1 Tax=Rhodocollybia butyracea TaxID=206335 RepID=A0A9P5PAA4_9AGAR|nr:acetyl-CoA synthetase-like protein [Rhodocollybia butyracea]
MSPLLTHLTNLEDATSRFPSRVAFKIPQVNPQTDDIDHWTDITFRQFLLDIEHLARYWLHVLKESNGIPQRSVIALCLGGYKYIDVVHVYAISRAGYIPQLVNIFPNADYAVIQGPLEQANARAFIYESVYSDIVRDIPIPCFTLVTVVHPNDYPLPDLPHVTGSDIAIIYQTSGTTSGKSKIVPCNYTWLDGCVRKMTRVPSDSGKVDIVSWCGSTGYMAQFGGLIGIIYRTSCTVQYRSGHPSTSEIVDNINRCQTKQLFAYPHFLREYIRASRTDPETLRALSSVDSIIYIGSGLGSDEDEEWAWRNGINLVSSYGKTECGKLLLSEGLRKSRQNYLKRLPGPSLIKFIPISNDSDLLELVVPPEAPECPDVSLRSSDGSHHTNDLFREVEPGSYVFCGRNDDWFIMHNSKLCDTKAIEDNARSTCGDIISDCVVVGNGRPSPVLVVEACSPPSPRCSASPTLNESELKTEIYRRICSFHTARFPHERITSPDMILIVPLGTLPRTVTKATVRRKVIEETMKEKLDRLFSGNV